MCARERRMLDMMSARLGELTEVGEASLSWLLYSERVSA